jgi:hypothetical protein
MTAVCLRCSRANPADASFCYFDGQPLPGRTLTGPLQASRIPFPSPFVFPNGTTCSNFDQLAVACQKNWETARELLREGHWERFMTGIGRLDLAKLASQAQKEEDADQALDRFLSKVPSDALPAPKLSVEPTLLNLGQLRPGVDHGFELAIVNLGTRLLRGSARVHCDWLTLGDGPGAPEVFFQTPLETTLKLRVLGKNFRGESRVKQGTVSILTNGGEEVIVVKAEARIVPFPEGILAGATTPREVAVRARQQPKVAARLFERGLVEAWYRANGWEYPVQGPVGSGLGAIQQFFEALGLVKPPIVTVEPQQLRLRGSPGRSIHVEVEIKSTEQKPVFAHVESSEPWLIVDEPIFAGNVVTVPVRVAVVPQSGPTLSATLQVRANGNQNFEVPVTLEINVDWNRAETEADLEPPKKSKKPVSGWTKFWRRLLKPPKLKKKRDELL